LASDRQSRRAQLIAPGRRSLKPESPRRIKAVNNKDRNFTRASLTKFIELADAKLDDYLQRLDQSDAAETKTGRPRVKNLAEKIAAIRERTHALQGDMLAQLDRTREDQIVAVSFRAGPGPAIHLCGVELGSAQVGLHAPGQA
jgi:hypothetical protein